MCKIFVMTSGTPKYTRTVHFMNQEVRDQVAYLVPYSSEWTEQWLRSPKKSILTNGHPMTTLFKRVKESRIIIFNEKCQFEMLETFGTYDILRWSSCEASRFSLLVDELMSALDSYAVASVTRNKRSTENIVEGADVAGAFAFDVDCVRSIDFSECMTPEDLAREMLLNEFPIAAIPGYAVEDDQRAKYDWRHWYNIGVLRK